MLKPAITIATLLLGASIVDDEAEAGRGGRAGKRKGKVVRVERSSLGGGGGTIRICQMAGSSTATCYGHPPEIGDVGDVLDGNTMYGQARVASLAPVTDSCGNTTGYTATLEAQSGNISQLTYGVVMVIDYDAGAQSRTLPLSGQLQLPSGAAIPGARVGEYIYVTIDRDGDAYPDLYVSAYTCDATGAVVAYGQGQTGYCMGYFVNQSDSWSLVRTDIVRSC